MKIQFSILFVSVNPLLIKFKQRTQVAGENKAMVVATEEATNALYNGMYNFYFSNKRTIDKLRLRIT